MNLILLEQEKDGRWLAENAGIWGAYAYGSTQGEALRKINELSERVPDLDRDWLEWGLPLCARFEQERGGKNFMSDWSESFPARWVLDALLRDGWKQAEDFAGHRAIHWPGLYEDRFPSTLFPFSDADMLGPLLLSRMAVHLQLKRQLIVKRHD